MAAPSSLYRSSITIDSISRSFGSLSQGLNKSRKTISNINKNISGGNEVKRKSLSRSSLLFQRKRENIRRKKQKSLLELSRLGSVFAAPTAAISNTGKSFLGRMMSFAGAIMAGWLVYNLPTIAAMANELGARVVRLTEILGEFLPNTGRIITNLGDVLGAYTTNILSFDFFDNSKRVEKSMDKLNSEFLRMHDSFNEALALITTPLTEGLGGRESAPPFGTDYSQTPGTGGKLQPIHRQALDIIAGPESGGNYNAMNQGTDAQGKILGSGDSKKIIGKALTDMTIGEVMDRQNESKYPRGARPDRGIHAAGKYQIIGSTMKQALKLSGLSKSDKFSPENQDLLALAVLKSQGPGAWTKYSRYTKEEIDIMYKAKDTPLATTPSQPSTSRPAPTPGPKGTLTLIPQTGSGGFIQGKTGKGTGTHFHIDDKTGNYTPEVLANIREVAFRAIKAMQARGSTVFLTNYSQEIPASKNDSILKSQILQEQQKHDERSTPGIDIQEQNPNVKSTYPGWPGSATKFPYAVGAVKWRGGYGNEAEILGSNGLTVSHGAEGSTASQVPQEVSSTKLSSTQIASAAKPLNAAVAAAPERRGSAVIVMPQEQQPQMIPSSSGSSLPSSSVAQAPINNSRNIFLTDLAYT